ncbi:MAG: hypothetical protein ILP04_01465, partial [Bacteroidales bacterium]|nr:hypothetical protein [Bacteroidales bacterium]
SWWTLLAGLLAGLAACTKQYGIGFAPVCLLWIALLGTGSWKNRLQGGLLFVLGMGLCLATVGLVFPETLSLFQLHDAYGTDQKAAVLYRKMGGLRFIPKRLGYLTFRCMPLLLCLIPPLGRISRTRLRLLLPLACGFFGFTGQFYFSNGWHYLLYIFPFAALLSALALQDFAERGPWTRLLLTAVLLFSVGSLSAQALDPGAFRKKKKQYRIERHVAKMLQQVPPEAVLLPYNAELYGQYWISGLQPPKVNGQYCLSFGPLALNESLMNQKIAHSQYLVKYKRSSHWEYKPHASTEALLQACDTVSHDAGFCLLCNPNFTE